MNTGNFFEALTLMVIGLITVFAVLCLIVVVGNLLISIVNKYFPEEEKPANVAKTVAKVDAKVAQAIQAAVNQLTNGKGKVEKIEKI